jgi:hypothetical protein
MKGAIITIAGIIAVAAALTVVQSAVAAALAVAAHLVAADLVAA